MGSSHPAVLDEVEGVALLEKHGLDQLPVRPVVLHDQNPRRHFRDQPLFSGERLGFQSKIRAEIFRTSLCFRDQRLAFRGPRQSESAPAPSEPAPA